jgi:hypothetical protein
VTRLAVTRLTGTASPGPRTWARATPARWARWAPTRWAGRRRTPAWRLGALTAAATQAVLLFWWIGFYPGTLSFDSVAYVWQVSTGNWTTQHSVLYNGLVWLSLRATGQLAVLTLAQTVVLAAGLAYAVVGLYRLGAPGRWLGFAALAAVCVPMVGTFAVYVSKDVAFALTQVWLVGTVARIIKTRPRHAFQPRPHEDGPSVPRGQWLALAAELVLLGLFRQNGFAVIAVTGVVLALVLSGIRVRVLLCSGAAIAVAGVANLFVYPALGVRPAGPELVLGPAYSDIAVAYAQRPREFTPADLALMTSVAPLSYWRSTANCYNSDSTVRYSDPNFNIKAARNHSTELAQLWVRLVKRMPDEIASTRLCRGSIAWNPFPGPARGRTVKIPIAGVSSYFDFPVSRLDASPYRGAIRLAPLSPAAHQAGMWLRKLSDTRQFDWFAWRGATWSYVAYLALILYARRRRDVAVLGLGAVILANQLNVVLNNPSQLARYLAGPLILGILLLPLAFARPRRDSGADERPTAQG